MTFRIKPILNPAGIDRDGNKVLLDKYHEDLGALLSGILKHEEFLNDSPKFSQMRKNLGKDNLCGMIIRIAKKCLIIKKT